MFYDLASTMWGQKEVDAIQRGVAEGRLTMGEAAHASTSVGAPHGTVA